MPYKLNLPQYENVLALTPKERYSHFLGKVGDWQQLWGLFDKDKGWLTREVSDSIQYLSVWPHPTYAKAISDKHYPGYSEREIVLEEFVSSWLPKLNSDNVKIGVFPNEEGNVWLMEASELLVDLQDECAQYE